MIRKLGWSAILCAALGACSFHASAQGGSRTASQHERGAAEGKAGAGQVARDHDRPDVRHDTLARPETSAPAAPESAPTAHDHDRGHGNDADRVDEDNPGKSKGSDKALSHANNRQHDHDRGHGNDADGVDEQNPGKSKGKKSK